MAECDRAAVGVHVLGVLGQPELAQHGQRLGGEGLVEFDQVDFADGEPEPGQQLAGRRHRSDAHDARRHAGRGKPRTRARGVRPWRFTAASEAIIIAAAPSLTPEELPAVTVPPL